MKKLYISSKYKHVHLLTLHICTTTYYSYINSICIFTIHAAWSDVNLSTVPFQEGEDSYMFKDPNIQTEQYVPERDPLRLSPSTDLKQIGALYGNFKSVNDDILPSSTTFNTALFLHTVHKDKTMEELRTGAMNLSDTLSVYAKLQENLARDHFGLFVKCADGLSTLNKQRDEFVPDYDEVAKLEDGQYNNRAEVHLKLSSIILQECCTLSDVFLGPILDKMKLNTKIKRYKSVLRVLATIIEYPTLIKEAFQKQDYNLVCIIYEQLRRNIPSSLETKSRIVSFVRAQTNEILKYMKEQIFDKLEAYCVLTTGDDDGGMDKIVTADHLSSIMTHMHFLHQLYGDVVINEALLLLLEIFRKNLAAIVAKVSPDSEHNAVKVQVNDPMNNVDFDKSGGDDPSNDTTLRSIDELFGFSGLTGNNTAEHVDESTLSEWKRIRGVHDIKKLIKTMLPFVCAIFDMRKQAVSNLSPSAQNFELLEASYKKFIAPMTTAVKKLRNMIFLPDTLSQKLMHSAMDDVHVVFDIIRHSSSMLALHIQSTLSSLEALLLDGKKIQIDRCCQQLSLFGLRILNFSDDNDERRTKIRNLLEKRFLSSTDFPVRYSLSLVALSYDIAHVHKYFGDNKFFLVIYMYEMYAILSLIHMYKLIHCYDKSNVDSEQNDDDDNDNKYRVSVSEMSSFVRESASKSVQTFVVSLKQLLVRNITTISMKGDKDTFEDLVLLLNTNSNVSFRSANPQNFNGKIHHVIHLLEALIFLRFISLVKLCRLFEIELFDEDGDDDNDDYAVIGNSNALLSLLGGISMSSSLPALSFPRHLICMEYSLICVYITMFRQNIDKIVSNGIANIKFL